MELISDSHIALAPLQVTEEQPPVSRLVLGGALTDTRVAGKILEACVRAGDETLILTTDDVPFEETLHIHLLGANHELIESVTIGAAYHTGLFRSPSVDAADALSFDFMGALRWTVRVSPSPSWHVPYLSDPPGVSRRLRFSTRLHVSAQDHAE
ncbi:hypothetical protein [Nitrogeniibacter aestuarii]|uniref:hypothetical protein n=1 Tax=Nitrogeniibacter aestuarii TaxID=2815343 RepID=UPI001D104DED|nr:hypothetical protein [Nitrogeniibacter aestuarii]